MRIGAVAATLTALIACDPQPGGGPSTTGVLRVAAGWHDTVSADFTTDRGYRIHLDAYMINTYSVELIPCDEELFRQLQEPRQKPGVSAGLSQLRFISPALAGHGDPTRPTRTGAILPESGPSDFEAVPLQIDTLDPPDYAYCKIHYLIGRVPNDDEHNVLYPGLAGTSLRLTGTYTSLERSTPVPFTIETSAAHGVLTAFDGPADGVTLKAGDTVLVQRHFQAMLNGVDFETMTEQQQARQVLRNLVDGTTVRVVSAGDGADA